MAALMKNTEMTVVRITAIVNACEDVLERAKTSGDKYSAMLAKETAYDHIKKIIKGEDE